MKPACPSPFYLAAALLLSVLTLTLGCSKSQPTPASPETTNTQPAAASVEPVSSASSSAATLASSAPAPKVNGNHAMQYVREVVAFGPRPPGSQAHVKLEQYILSKLHGIDVEQDRFTAQTPDGKFPINNIIAKFPGKKHGDYRYRRPLRHAVLASQNL